MMLLITLLLKGSHALFRLAATDQILPVVRPIYPPIISFPLFISCLQQLPWWLLVSFGAYSFWTRLIYGPQVSPFIESPTPVSFVHCHDFLLLCC